LLHLLWPETKDAALARQSLDTLIYGVHKLLGPALGGHGPIVHEEGWHRLNDIAGIHVDVVQFEALATAGDMQMSKGDREGAIDSYTRAVAAYTGDLCVGTDVAAVIESERLRATHLTLLAHLAEHHYEKREYASCLTYARRLLRYDPCREDAHRMVMRCHVRQGERAQALRQYRTCEHILQAEFDAGLEPATVELFELICQAPARV
jgi:DNA-binding SARP family transcriptional activator